MCIIGKCPTLNWGCKSLICSGSLFLKGGKEDFIIIDESGSVGGTLCNKDDNLEEIVDYLKREPSFSKYVYGTGSRAGHVRNMNYMEGRKNG